MRSFFTLVKKDLKGYFDQPTGYILLVIFIGVVSFLFFRGLENSREASLRPLFEIMILQWMILPIFVAASTMRLMAEEQRDGTLEILLTHPIRVWSVIFAKFLSGLAFVGLGIILTIGIPIALTTAAPGGLDSGAIAAQYIGTTFLTASFVAMGLFTSSLTRNQIVAFMIGLALIMGFMAAGLPIVAPALPPAVAVLVQDLSPITHYSSIARGILNLRDVIYFVALVSVFLSATYLMIRGKSISHRSPLYRNLQLGVAGLVVIGILVGWFGTSIKGRLDLTENKLYSFSQATKDLMAGLDDLVTIKVFVSDNLPPPANLVGRDLNDFVDSIADLAPDKIKVLRRSPHAEDEDSLQEARENLVRPIQFSVQSEGELQIKLGYLGISLTYVNQREMVPVVRSTNGLEYTVASAVFRMIQRDPKTVVFLDNNEDPRARFEEDAPKEFEGFRTALEEQNQVETIRETRTGLVQFGGVDVLVVAGPKRHMSATTTREIDGYLAGGGQALFLLDAVEVDTQRLGANPNSFSLAGYLEKYGVIPQSDVVFDVRSHESLTVPDVFAPVVIPYPYWVRVPETDARISGAVNAVVFPWASSLQTTETTEAGIEIEEVTPLVKTTQFAVLDKEFQNLFPQSPHLLEVDEDQQAERLLAVAITGTRCPPGEPGCVKDPSKRFRIIVVGDSDWIGDGWANQSPGHIEMATNWIDWLAQDDALAAIRAKGVSIRTLLYDSETHRNLVRYSTMAGVPALFVVLGLLRYFMRRNATRKAYAREK